MDLIKSLKAATDSNTYLPAVPMNRGVSATVGVDRATGINPYGLTGFRFELFPMENPRLLREGYRNNHIVFTIADWKAQRLSEATPLLYRVKSRKHYARYVAYVKNDKPIEAMIERRKALEEIDDPTHPILKLLNNPNERQTWAEFAYAWSIYFDFGNALVYGQRLSMGANKGQIRRLYPLPPHIYEGENPTVAGYDVFQSIIDPAVRLSGKDVLHCARFDSEQGHMGGTLWGMSKLTPARALLAKSKASIEAQAELFGNRGSRWILFPKSAQFNEKTNVAFNARATNPDMPTDALRKKLSQGGAGGIAGNAFELDGIDLSMSMVDMDVINSDKVTKDDFCALWHTHAGAIFSSESSTYANADAAVKASLRAGVLPDQRLLAQKLTTWLTPNYEEGLIIEFDTDVYPELQANKTEIAIWCDAAGLTMNERRRLFGNDEINMDGMDIPLVKAGLTPVTDLVAMPAEPVDPTRPVPDPAKNDGSYA